MVPFRADDSNHGEGGGEIKNKEKQGITFKAKLLEKKVSLEIGLMALIQGMQTLKLKEKDCLEETVR